MQLFIFLGGSLLRLFCAGARVFVVRQHSQIVSGGNFNVGSDSVLLDCLALGSVVLGNGKDQRGTVWNLDKLLHGTIAEGLVAQHVAAPVLLDGARHYFGWARSSAINQHY